MESFLYKEKLKVFSGFIHKYFTQLLFLPLLCGGLQQIIILFLISPQAVRFFSPPQAIADGLLYLVIVILYVFSIFIFFFGIIVIDLLTSDSKKIQDQSHDEEPKKPHKYSHEQMPLSAHIVIFLVTIFCYFILFIRQPKNLDLSDPKIEGIIAILYIVFLLNFSLSITLMRFIFFKKEYYFKKNQNVFLMLNFLLCLISVFIFSVYSSKNTNSFSNFKRIEEKYRCEKSGTIKIVYFNDKFLFIERKCTNEKQELIIEKFDAFFENK